jgi:hemerythrin superfamily protein
MARANRGSKSNGGRRTGRSAARGGFMNAVIGGLNKIADAVAPDDGLDALDLLKAQHRGVEKLFAQIQGARGAAKGAAFRELADLLAIHATIEERVFYPSVRRGTTEELLQESVQEHLEMKRVLADMMQLDPADEEFDAKLSVLEEQVTHHAKEEEERKLFPLVRSGFDRDLMAALAGEMIALMVELQQQGSPRAAVPGETDAPAAL